MIPDMYQDKIAPSFVLIIVYAIQSFNQKDLLVVQCVKLIK